MAARADGMACAAGALAGACGGPRLAPIVPVAAAAAALVMGVRSGPANPMPTVRGPTPGLPLPPLARRPVAGRFFWRHCCVRNLGLRRATSSSSGGTTCRAISNAVTKSPANRFSSGMIKV